MIANLQPYSEYKESSLPWLGRIPAHWNEQPGFAVFREKQEKNTGLREKRVLSLSYGHIVIKSVEKLHGLVPDSFETYQIVNPGDLIIRSTDLQNDWNSLRVGLVRDRGIITSAYLCFKNIGLFTPEFAFFLLHSYDLQKFFYGLGSGLRQNLDFGDFKRLPFPVPPPEEQTAIVRFLDHAYARIERAIRAKRNLIALLNEQKQAIIHRAVTGQDQIVEQKRADGTSTFSLQPSTLPKKPSGIPWLGDIPKHWEVTRLKFEATHIVDCLHATPKYIPDGPFPAIRTADIEPGKVRLSQARRLSAQEYARWTSRLVPREADILYSREGERFGIAALVPKEVQLCISQRMMIFRIKPSQLSEFLMWQLNCKHVFAQASCDIIGSTAPHVNVEQIKNYRLVMPPRQEQEQIVAYIAKECSTLNTAISRLEREIALLREYRTRLTADVVTGKLDVRAAARQLPVGPVEPAPAPAPGELAGETEADEVVDAA